MTSATVYGPAIRSARIGAAVAVAVAAVGLLAFVTVAGGGRATEAACTRTGFISLSVEVTYIPPELTCHGEWWGPGHEAGPVGIDRTGDLLFGLAAVALIDIFVVVAAVVATRVLLPDPPGRHRPHHQRRRR